MAATDILGFLWNSSGDRTFSINDPGVGSFEVDILDQETHEWSREITNNPIENGSPVGDHIIRQPEKITISGMISNAPISGVFTQISNAIDNGFDGNDRVQQAIDQLYAMWESDGLITIYTKNRMYTDMLISNITIPRRVQDGEAVNFTISAQHVRIVSTATTELPPGVGVKKETSASGKAGKSNSPEQSTANRATPNKDIGKSTGSILSQATDGLSSAGSKLSDYLKGKIGAL